MSVFFSYFVSYNFNISHPIIRVYYLLCTQNQNTALKNFYLRSEYIISVPVKI